MTYARQEGDKIVRYSTLPREITHNGQIVMGIRSADYQTLAGYGFYPLVTPEFDSRTHKRSNLIQWDETMQHFKYTVESLGVSLDDIKKQLRTRLKGYWKDAFQEGKPYSDFLKATNQTMPEDVEAKINALYGLLATIKGQINALDNLQDALDYELPMSDINEGLEYLRDLI
jgi:hypothetical protein